MTTRKKLAYRSGHSRLLEAADETMRNLFAAGGIDRKRMAAYEALRLPKIPAYSGSKIRALRHRHRLSQAVMASVLNTSLSTVRQWEIGEKHPSGTSRKLLYLLDSKGLEALT